MDSIEKRILDIIDAHAREIIAFGDDIWHHAELGYREHRTSGKFADVMKSLGLDTQTGIAITGVKSYLKPKEDGEVRLALIGELDALPISTHPDAWSETGAAHCCGHNAQLTGVMGAALALADPEVSAALGGNVVFMAAPAEEGGDEALKRDLIAQGLIQYPGGKCELIHTGALDDISMAVGHHMSDSADQKHVVVNARGMGMVEKTAIFHGKASHVGTSADGIDAQAAALLAMNAINTARESFASSYYWEDYRYLVHTALMTNAKATNIVTDEARLGFSIRGQNAEQIDALAYRVERAVKGAAMALGAGVEIRTTPGYLPFVTLSDASVIREAFELADPEGKTPILEKTPNGRFRGTSDFGDVSNIMPLLFFNTGGQSGDAHTDTLRVVDPMEYYIMPAKIFALTAYRLLKDDAVRVKQLIHDNPPRITAKQWREDKEKLRRVEKVEMDIAPDLRCKN